MIANAEGYPGDPSGARLLREAELQLWIWRAEQRRLSVPKLRRAKSGSPLAA
jgi:hypothetical protein